MELIRYTTAEELLAAAGDFLVEREAEHNLPLGILATLRDQPEIHPEPPYLATVLDGSRIALVAVRTPPFGVVLSEPGVPPGRLPGASEALVADLLQDAADLPTASGPKTTVEAFAKGWAEAAGRVARLELAERTYRISRTVPAPPTPGSWRLAAEADRGLLRDWLAAFHAEALPAGSARVESEALIARLTRQDDRFAYLWEAGRRPVSLVVAGSRTPNGRRIGPVYTPPAFRGRGFATALTAAASQDQLDRGARFCFLFTDLANPTSNAIYQRIGYEPVSDFDQYRFEGPSSGRQLPGSS